MQRKSLLALGMAAAILMTQESVLGAGTESPVEGSDYQISREADLDEAGEAYTSGEDNQVDPVQEETSH